MPGLTSGVDAIWKTNFLKDLAFHFLLQNTPSVQNKAVFFILASNRSTHLFFGKRKSFVRPYQSLGRMQDVKVSKKCGCVSHWYRGLAVLVVGKFTTHTRLGTQGTRYMVLGYFTTWQLRPLPYINYNIKNFYFLNTKSHRNLNCSNHFTSCIFGNRFVIIV